MNNNNNDYGWLVRAIIEDDSDSGISVQKYSGRGMYGKHCLGFVTRDQFTGSTGIVSIFVDYIRDSMQDSAQTRKARIMLNQLADLLDDAREDNMGLGMVLYFPKVSWNPSWDVIFPDDDDSEDTSEADDED